MMSRLFTIGLAAAVQCACASAPRARAFPDLPRYIEQGSAIRLTDTTGQTTTGRLDTLSPASLKLLTDDRLRDVPEHLVVKIEQRERQAGRGALLGLGVGFGVGLIAARSQESSGNPLIDTQARGLSLAAATVLGTAAGAIAGALVKVYRTVYQAPKPTVNEAVASVAETQGSDSTEVLRHVEAPRVLSADSATRPCASEESVRELRHVYSSPWRGRTRGAPLWRERARPSRSTCEVWRNRLRGQLRHSLPVVPLLRARGW